MKALAIWCPACGPETKTPLCFQVGPSPQSDSQELGPPGCVPLGIEPPWGLDLLGDCHLLLECCFLLQS